MGGMVLQDPDKLCYNIGDVFTLIPTPKSGFIFDRWTCVHAANLVDNADGTWSITMDADKSIIANFVKEVIDSKTHSFLSLILK